MPEGVERPQGCAVRRDDRRDDLTVGTRLASAHLSPIEAATLTAAARPWRSVAAHTDLVIEGGQVDHLFVVKRGWAFRYKTKRDGRRQIVGLLLPGDVVNLDALMGARPCYGVRAIGRAEVAPIHCGDMRNLAERHPGVNTLLMRLALIHASILTQWSLVLGAYSAEQKIAHLLCELSVRLAGDGGADDGRAGDGGAVDAFDLPLTQELIGEAVGLTGVHVNRVMRSLHERELVTVRGRTVFLPGLATLRRLSEFDPGYLQV